MKLGEDYKLYSHDSCIATTHESPYKRLSKQNCDEIFGVIDVEKLAYKTYEPETFVNHSDMYKYLCIKFFKEGFNKAMELNKDKLFTIEDMYEAIRKAKSYDEIPNHDGVIVSFDYSKEEIIQSLQEPTEIEVEIEMDIAMDGHTVLGYELDANGCLILKKK
jgi:hypothetical protein